MRKIKVVWGFYRALIDRELRTMKKKAPVASGGRVPRKPLSESEQIKHAILFSLQFYVVCLEKNLGLCCLFLNLMHAIFVNYYSLFFKIIWTYMPYFSVECN